MSKEFGIKPYIDLPKDKRNHVDLMRTPTWDNQFANREEKHSELVKPYDWDNYGQQEHFYPPPLFHPEWPYDQPTTELIVDRPDINGCLITAIGNFATLKDDCEYPIRGRFLQVSGTAARANPSRIRIFMTNAIGDILSEIHNIRVTFDGLDRFEIRPPIDATNGWSDYFLEGHGAGDHAHIRIEYTDPNETVCSANVAMYCAACACPSGTFDFDDASTPDTIAPGGSITLYVTGGCPPYDWSLTDTGYTLDAASTEDISNGLTSASGSCGVDYDPDVTITVTDNCGDSVQFIIRNTGGQWSAAGSCNWCITGTNDDNCGIDPKTRTIISGDHRWIFHTQSGRTCWSNAGTGWTASGGGCPTGDCPSSRLPPCGSPTDCADWSCSGCSSRPYPAYHDFFHYRWTC